jgi:hypothetical protein
VQDILVLTLHLKDCPYEARRLVQAKFTQAPSSEKDNLIPAGIVQQWFEHMLILGLPLISQAESGKIFLESQMEKAVDTTAVVIETALQKNTTKLADIAAEL